MQTIQSIFLALSKKLSTPFLIAFALMTVMALAFILGLYPSGPKDSGTFKIKELKKNASPIHTTYAYVGTFEGLPCRIFLPFHKPRPPANKDYYFSSGTLREGFKGQYIFKPHSDWEPVPNTWSIAEWRFQLKETVKKQIFQRYKDPQVATLFAGLATGNMENPLLSFHFRKAGLAHLLAVSGFHFALLAFFLASILRRIFPEKLFALTLLLLLGGYFFYMGGSPSISRAWIGILLYFVGVFFGYSTRPLNALGIALLFALTDPFVITTLGFQLSFAATLGIILFYVPIDRKLEKLLPKRPYVVLYEMSTIDQVGYLLCSYLRKGLALQGSVLSLTLPLIFYHFETYPLLSLVYNLFVPYLFALLLALFLLHLDFLAAPTASFLITVVEGAPRELLFKVNWWQGALIIILTILIKNYFIVWEKLTKIPLIRQYVRFNSWRS